MRIFTRHPTGPDRRGSEMPTYSTTWAPSEWYPTPINMSRNTASRARDAERHQGVVIAMAELRNLCTIVTSPVYCFPESAETRWHPRKGNSHTPPFVAEAGCKQHTRKGPNPIGFSLIFHHCMPLGCSAVFPFLTDRPCAKRFTVNIVDQTVLA